MEASCASAHAQWGFPGAFGGFGWEGWGGTTVAGDEARGLGMFAAGLGTYNKLSAEAEKINAETVKRWNEYLYQSQLQADIRRRERAVQRVANNRERAETTLERLRKNPTERDILSGDALNAALNDLNDPRIYTKALDGANEKIAGEKVRSIPFRYNAAAVTLSIHQLATGEFPAGLQSPEFAAERESLRALDAEITKQIESDQDPDPATVRMLLKAIYDAEEKAAKVLPANTLQLRQAEKYLKALHGLVSMLKTPSLEGYLAGVVKRPETTYAELLRFMNAFNLRFGPATTPQQRAIYTSLYPGLAKLRDQVAPALAATSTHPSPGVAQDFFNWMSFGDLSKSAPKP
ncbi:MAG: hypothetical protein ABS79_07785 [Planctomycetes bacterium SCN 63-9]|nr:MAG: hypothetical protein ABS79_07785 [Planctomycetes bacterium SCN 63-9]